MSSRSRSRSLSVVLLSLWVGGCGGLTAALSTLGGGGGEGNTPTTVGDLTVGSDASDLKAAPLTFSFRLTDAQSDSVDVQVLYVVPGGSPASAQLVGNASLAHLSASPQGIVHVRQWDFASQLPTGSAFAPGLRLIVQTSAHTSSTQSAPFDVGNDAAVISNVQVPSGQSGGIAPLSLVCSDSSSDIVSVAAEYEDLTQTAGWRPATAVGAGLTNVASTPAGVPLVFFWDVGVDEPGRNFDARLRFTANDGTTLSAPVVSPAFAIHDNAAPVVVVHGSAFIATSDDRRDIPLPFDVFDGENDHVRLVFQWHRPFETILALPSDNAALDAILADEQARLTYHVATEEPLVARGRVIPIGPTTLRCAELATSASGVRLSDIVGRSVDVLRASQIPVLQAVTWSANPLAAPAAALPRHDGRTALVLDSAGAGTWQLREIDLATGSVVTVIVASGSGNPDAMTRLDADQRVLVAVDLAGVWSLVEVDLATGTTTSWITTSGTSSLGPVRGLVATGGQTCLLTSGSALVSVDATDLSLPVETVRLGGLSAPWGIAVAPNRKDKLYMAERDWINPSTSTVDGRVITIDLSSLTTTQVVTSGVSLHRPDALAFDTMRARLLVMTDQNTADGLRELCAADVGGENGTPAWIESSSLPNGVSGIATGSEGTRIVTLGAGNDLAVGGGVQQTRTITAYGPIDGQVSVASAFQPALSALQEWRIVSSSTSLIPVNGSATGTFVWDSADLSTGGDVVLQATPYDSQQGQSTDTEVPRLVRSPIDVHATSIGGIPTTNGVRAIAVGDVNGDGRPDIVTANTSANSLSVFYSTGSGQFPSSPNVVLTGQAPLATMTAPIAVVLADVDHDGRMDIVSANRDSNNLTVFLQTSSGTFSLQSPALSSSSTAPSGVAAGDVNGDGLTDIVVANAGSADLKIFQQLGSGLFSPIASSTLACGAGSSPSGLALGDLNGDGRVDIAVATAGSNHVLVFLQSAGGSFSAPPSLTLGASGVTDSPSAVDLGDLDGDGSLDIACANVGDNNVAVFMQTAPGVFPTSPTFLLSSNDGPFQPASLAIADVNADGALDVTATSVDGALVAYFYDREAGTFAAQDLRIDGEGAFATPTGIAASDLDGDGRTDLVVANSGLSQVAVMLQRRGGSFNPVPDATLGSSNDTSNPSAIAVGDLDVDGFLDLVCANEGTGDLAIYQQLSPTVVGTQPKQRLGTSTTTIQVKAVEIADIDGDGRPDIVTANAGAGTLTVFFQAPDGTFPTLPDVSLGGLSAPAALVVADLDGDGDLDLASANTSGNDLRIFLQTAPRVFATPGITLGSAASTGGPVELIAADFNGDGRLDLASANQTANTITFFLQTSLGTFPSVPNFSLGSGAVTPSPCALAVADVDNDGLLDLACASRTGNKILFFRETAPGVFNAVPIATLTHATMQQPTSIVLADFDRDGSIDLFVGATTSQNLCLFRQLQPWVFATAPDLVGGPSTTGAPKCIRAIDFDGDGDADLVLARPSFNSMAIFYNSH